MDAIVEDDAAGMVTVAEAAAANVALVAVWTDVNEVRFSVRSMPNPLAMTWPSFVRTPVRSMIPYPLRTPVLVSVTVPLMTGI